MTFWLALVLLAAPSGSCDDLPSTRQLLARARAFEITALESDHASALLEGLAECRTSPARTACEAEHRRELRRAVETFRAAVGAKYRGLVEEVEASCRAPLA